MESSFPKCPICGSSVGYYVSGVFQKYSQCQSCEAKWKLRLSRGQLAGLMLHELPKNGQGLYRVNAIHAPLYVTMGKEYPIDFWSKVTLGNQIDWEYLRESVAPNVINAASLGKGERILTSWDGSKMVKEKLASASLSGKTIVVKKPESGALLLTNRRILWMKIRLGTKGRFWSPKTETSVLVKNEIILEEVKGITASNGDSEMWAIPKDVHIVNGKGEHKFQLFYTSSELFKPIVESAISLRQNEIEQEKKQAKVHMMLDFSFLKKYMEDGGLVMQTLKCLECGASVKFPDTGSQTVCRHCGANIYANEIFKKIRELIG